MKSTHLRPIPRSSVPVASPNSFEVLCTVEPEPTDVDDSDDGESMTTEGTTIWSRGASPSLRSKRRKLRAQRREKAEWRRLPVGSAERTLARINEHPAEAGDIVRRWTHPHRHAEVTDELLEVLMTTYPPDALDALDALREPPSYIRAMNGNSMMIPVTLEGLNNLQGCSVTGLIDSGATGGFINESVVEERGMEREALPIPVPVYNADGTLNKGGLITHVVRL